MDHFSHTLQLVGFVCGIATLIAPPLVYVVGGLIQGALEERRERLHRERREAQAVANLRRANEHQLPESAEGHPVPPEDIEDRVICVSPQCDHDTHVLPGNEVALPQRLQDHHGRWYRKLKTSVNQSWPCVICGGRILSGQRAYTPEAAAQKRKGRLCMECAEVKTRKDQKNR